jgi:chromosome partitioning protein
MHTILVANIKGGCGKTTIATHLAAAAATHGRRTVLADLDRQRSSLGWAERRQAWDRSIEAVDWSKDIGTMRHAAAAMRRRDIEALLELADMVVLPIMPGAYDEHATERFIRRLEEAKPIAKGKIPVAVVANRVRPNTRAAARLDEFLGGIEHAATAHLRDTQLYNDLAVGGQSLFDLGSKRALEYRDDWAPLTRFVERDLA